MQDPKTESPRQPVNPANGKSETPAPDAIDTPKADDEASPGMMEEGDRPAPDRGSVEDLPSADRPGGMAGEG